jgi:hypothetical protein
MKPAAIGAATVLTCCTIHLVVVLGAVAAVKAVAGRPVLALMILATVLLGLHALRRMAVSAAIGRMEENDAACDQPRRGA